MPFTPYHWGPAILLGVALPMLFDLPALMIASVINDVEPFIVLFLNVQGYAAHGFFHSYLGASFLGLATAGIVIALRNPLDAIMKFFRLSRESSVRVIAFSSFFGVYLHVFLDSFLYADLLPFYPLPGNVFVNLFPAAEASMVIYGFCGITGILGIVVYWFKLFRMARAEEKTMKATEREAKKLTTAAKDNDAEEVEKADE